MAQSRRFVGELRRRLCSGTGSRAVGAGRPWGDDQNPPCLHEVAELLWDQILAGVGVGGPVGGLVAPGPLVGDEIGRLNGWSSFDRRWPETGNWSWVGQSVGGWMAWF